MNGAKGRKHKRRREKEDERSPINRLDARFEPSTGSDDETKEKVVEWRRRGAPPSVFQMVRYCATATPHRGSFRQSGLGRRQRQYDGARADRLGSEAPSILAVRATNIKHLIPQFPSPNLPSQPNHHLIQRIRGHSPNPVVESANVCQCLIQVSQPVSSSVCASLRSLLWRQPRESSHLSLVVRLSRLLAPPLSSCMQSGVKGRGRRFDR